MGRGTPQAKHSCTPPLNSRLGGQALGRVVSVSNYWWELSVTSHHWAGDGESWWDWWRKGGGWGQITDRQDTGDRRQPGVSSDASPSVTYSLTSDGSIQWWNSYALNTENYKWREFKFENLYCSLKPFLSVYDVGDEFAQILCKIEIGNWDSELKIWTQYLEIEIARSSDRIGLKAGRI